MVAMSRYNVTAMWEYLRSLLMSIAHRITGGALYMSMLIFTVFLISLTMGEKYYALYSFIAGSWLGKLAIIGITWAIFHHMFGGIRHFIWDTGRGFEIKTVDQLAALSLFGGIILTILYWLIFYIT